MKEMGEKSKPHVLAGDECVEINIGKALTHDVNNGKVDHLTGFISEILTDTPRMISFLKLNGEITEIIKRKISEDVIKKELKEFEIILDTNNNSKKNVQIKLENESYEEEDKLDSVIICNKSFKLNGCELKEASSSHCDEDQKIYHKPNEEIGKNNIDNYNFRSTDKIFDNIKQEKMENIDLEFINGYLPEFSPNINEAVIVPVSPDEVSRLLDNLNLPEVDNQEIFDNKGTPSSSERNFNVVPSTSYENKPSTSTGIVNDSILPFTQTDFEPILTTYENNIMENFMNSILMNSCENIIEFIDSNEPSPVYTYLEAEGTELQHNKTNRKNTRNDTKNPEQIRQVLRRSLRIKYIKAKQELINKQLENEDENYKYNITSKVKNTGKISVNTETSDPVTFTDNETISTNSKTPDPDPLANSTSTKSISTNTETTDPGPIANSTSTKTISTNTEATDPGLIANTETPNNLKTISHDATTYLLKKIFSPFVNLGCRVDSLEFKALSTQESEKQNKSKTSKRKKRDRQRERDRNRNRKKRVRNKSNTSISSLGQVQVNNKVTIQNYKSPQSDENSKEIETHSPELVSVTKKSKLVIQKKRKQKLRTDKRHNKNKKNRIIVKLPTNNLIKSSKRGQPSLKIKLGPPIQENVEENNSEQENIEINNAVEEHVADNEVIVSKNKIHELTPSKKEYNKRRLKLNHQSTSNNENNEILPEIQNIMPMEASEIKEINDNYNGPASPCLSCEAESFSTRHIEYNNYDELEEPLTPSPVVSPMSTSAVVSPIPPSPVVSPMSTSAVVSPMPPSPVVSPMSTSSVVSTWPPSPVVSPMPPSPVASPMPPSPELSSNGEASQDNAENYLNPAAVEVPNKESLPIVIELSSDSEDDAPFIFFTKSKETVNNQKPKDTSPSKTCKRKSKNKSRSKTDKIEFIDLTDYPDSEVDVVITSGELSDFDSLLVHLDGSPCRRYRPRSCKKQVSSNIPGKNCRNKIQHKPENDISDNEEPRKKCRLSTGSIVKAKERKRLCVRSLGGVLLQNKECQLTNLPVQN